MTASFGFPYLVFNTKEGVMASQPMRRAVQTALGPGQMLAAGFGDTRFFTAEAQHFPKGTPYSSATDCGPDPWTPLPAISSCDRFFCSE